MIQPQSYHVRLTRQSMKMADRERLKSPLQGARHFRSRTQIPLRPASGIVGQQRRRRLWNTDSLGGCTAPQGGVCVRPYVSIISKNGPSVKTTCRHTRGSVKVRQYVMLSEAKHLFLAKRDPSLPLGVTNSRLATQATLTWPCWHTGRHQSAFICVHLRPISRHR